MATFPPELVEIIVHDIWNSEMPSFIRKSFMTTCPRINRTWKAVYAPIASQDMYITNLAFLDYLCDISRARKSIIYHDFIPRLTRTITCFVDLRENKEERAAERVYRYLTELPNLRGFQALFELVHYISFQIVWMGIVKLKMSSPLLSPFRGIPIRVSYDRFVSNASPYHHQGHSGETRMRIRISIMDGGCWAQNPIYWPFALSRLRQVGVPGYFFTTGVLFPGPYRRKVRHGVRHIHYPTYIYETQLGSWDSKHINQRLWMASKGRPSTVLRLRCLSSFFYGREFKRMQSSLPVGNYSNRRRVPPSQWPLLETKAVL
ncbi:hypothetical protein EV421DRAFT_1908043 [Armillaria borealis]|uniref:Uncharacterized protein n=1 Tax=Armillaria borealis TaxID=47425 RepID=A0AA39J5C5_9AGAR|nr:hypothetical protein EV421DRAFT_1908043 [Armillaria borealis]